MEKLRSGSKRRSRIAPEPFKEVRQNAPDKTHAPIRASHRVLYFWSGIELGTLVSGLEHWASKANCNLKLI